MYDLHAAQRSSDRDSSSIPEEGEKNFSTGSLSWLHGLPTARIILAKRNDEKIHPAEFTYPAAHVPSQTPEMF